MVAFETAFQFCGFAPGDHLLKIKVDCCQCVNSFAKEHWTRRPQEIDSRGELSPPEAAAFARLLLSTVCKQVLYVLCYTMRNTRNAASLVVVVRALDLTFEKEVRRKRERNKRNVIS